MKAPLRKIVSKRCGTTYAVVVITLECGHITSQHADSKAKSKRCAVCADSVQP